MAKKGAVIPPLSHIAVMMWRKTAYLLDSFLNPATTAPVSILKPYRSPTEGRPVMDMKRKVARGVAVLSVALGIGHVMQGTDRAGAGVKPVAVTPLAAGVSKTDAATSAAKIAAVSKGAATVTKAGVTPSIDPSSIGEVVTLPTAGQPDTMAEPMAVVADATEMLPQPHDPMDALSLAQQVAALDAAPEQPVTAALSGDSINCPISFDLNAGSEAMIDITLLAPCRPNERVVLRHGGLVFTASTSLTGSLFLSIPGMDANGAVGVLFADGHEAAASVTLPDMADYRRFAVQWLANDAFQVHAFENGAAYGTEGHVSAADPKRRLAGIPAKGGFLTLVGDDTVDLPMLAEVYTYPTDISAEVEITVEAQVTEATCGRDMLAELLLSEGGKSMSTDLTLATPTCDAIGDVLVLNNPLPDLKLAAAN